jgi:hypothetical protein
MAIKVEQITTDITLEIDEDVISIADFQKATDNFIGLVREVSKGVTEHKLDPEDWAVKVYSGSIGVGVVAGPANHYSVQARNILVEGIRQLADGARPSHFSDKAIEHAKGLATLFKRNKLGPSVRIWSQTQESVLMERRIAKAADDLLAAAYEEDGAVDGVLQKLDGHGKLEFVIYDLIDDRSVKCEIKEELLSNALSNFNKRVEVIGTVKYRKDGMPVAIRASKIISFPDVSEIPSLIQMRELLSARKSA